VALRIHQEHRRLAVLHHRERERHRLGGGGALVQQRGVGHRQPGEVGHHGLEGEQRLEPALRDLGLVGRVGRVPSRVLEHVALDHRRREAAGIALADVAPEHRVAGAEGPQLGERLALGEPGVERERRGLADGRGHHVGDEGVEVAVAQHLEHRGDLVEARTDVAGDELVAGPGLRGAHEPIIAS